MSRCCGQDYDKFFDAKAARKELRAYRKRGARGATAHLLRLVQAASPQTPTLLDIGGGVGVIQQEMLKAGASKVTSVDASAAYLATMQSVANDHGYRERWAGIEGDFVALSGEIAPADVVTLDKVICCYPGMPALVSRSASKAEKLYGIVVPKDGWWVRVVAKIVNLGLRLLRINFQGFVHPHSAIDAEVEKAGLQMRASRSYWMWSIRVYARGSTEVVGRA